MNPTQPTWMEYPPSLSGRDCLHLSEYTPQEIEALLSLALECKEKHKRGEVWQPLLGKTLAMIFDKPSTRTRISFEAGMAQLGGHALALDRNHLQLGRGESIADTAQVFSGLVDGILIRTHRHRDVEELADYASIPVINGLTDLHHPCQALADLLTLKEVKGNLTGRKLVYVGDGNNVLHSLAEAAAHTGMHLVAATPPGYEPQGSILAKAKEIAKQTGATITCTHDPMEAAVNADAIYTDVWASMGQEEEKGKRERDFEGYQVNETLIKQGKPDVTFLHCLPAYRGLEVSREVIDGPHSVVFQQAENRLHAQKALLMMVLG
ncbi:ornithine carbamoyltransferase [Marininema halotolerans]|uniref:Ornithine carbamoyltransferase n=1 Tax=Marininema halotolerans TaxID=1155944 RepID=A0A1I6NZA5_9BACL|nr:ornithine carbamoyltransferase [Marininema halotolerans]SFS33158.1 ornithine carbamoyltransferase [Marininema halotolerans]